VSDQIELFETPQQRSAREHNERLAVYMEARRVESGYQCRECGGVARNEVLFWHGHGLMGTRCMAETFARNHTLYDLRSGDRARYMGSSGRLRAIGAWRRSRR
jgi:hypothetical protein